MAKVLLNKSEGHFFVNVKMNTVAQKNSLRPRFSFPPNLIITNPNLESKKPDFTAKSWESAELTREI